RISMLAHPFGRTIPRAAGVAGLRRAARTVRACTRKRRKLAPAGLAWPGLSGCRVGLSAAAQRLLGAMVGDGVPGKRVRCGTRIRQRTDRAPANAVRIGREETGHI